MKSPLLDFSVDKALDYAHQNFDELMYLTSNKIDGKTFLAFGVSAEFCSIDDFSFDAFQNYLDTQKTWQFGYFSYDLKNSIEDLSSENKDQLEL